MNNFKLSENSLKKLIGVHPDLIRVVIRAIVISKYDFSITQGLRTKEEQEELFKKGSSKTLDSLHLIQKDGYGHAIDFAVFIGGKITWDLNYYRPVIQAFFTAAIEEKVFIKSGGLWRTFIDGPHIELDSAFYGDKK